MPRYGMYRRGDELLLVAEALAERRLRARVRAASRANCSARRSAAISSARRCGIRFSTATRRSSAPTTSSSTPEPGSYTRRPGHGADDFDTGVRFGLPTLRPGRRERPLHRRGRAVCRRGDLRREPAHRRRSRAQPARSTSRRRYDHSYPHCWRCKNPVIFRATCAVVHRDGRQPVAQERRREAAARQLDAGVGRGPDEADDREPSRVVRLAPANVGHADPVDPVSRTASSRSSTPTSRARGRGARSAKHGADVVVDRRSSRRSSRPALPARRVRERPSRKSSTSSTSGSSRA